MAYIEQKSYDEALGYFNQAESAAESDDQKVNLNRGRGIACLYQGNYEDAVKWFNEALAVSSQSNDIRIDTLYYKAEAEQKSGQCSKEPGYKKPDSKRLAETLQIHTTLQKLLEGELV